MTRFACVHGLANARATVIAPRWQTWLRASGLPDAECFDVRWYSTASFAGDVVEFSADSIRRVFGSPTFRARALAEVSVRIRELVREDPTTVILAHSMGTPLTLLVLREMAAEGIPPPRCVFFGTPLGHPVHAAWLRALGFTGTPPCRVLSLWNADDLIVCPPDIDPVFPQWMDDVRIAVPDHCGRGLSSVLPARVVVARRVAGVPQTFGHVMSIGWPIHIALGRGSHRLARRRRGRASRGLARRLQ